MPVLLSDASSCSNDLGRILYTNPSEWNVHMNIISTNIMSSFFTSHIEYQMSICAIPCNSLAMDIRFFDMWTRFRDVKRLREQLADLHKKLHLHGSFPQFAEGVIFGNQSSQIVGERTSSITTFLNYVLGHPVLRQSKVLQDYFEASFFTEKFFNDVLQKAQEISKPLNHKNPLEPLRQFHSDGESSATSFGTNIIHVSKCKGQDPRLLFISEHEDSPAPSVPTAELFVQTYPMPATVMQRNSTMNMQENSVSNTTPLPMNTTSAMTNQTPASQSSYVLPAYYCFAVSQQSQSSQVSRANNAPLQQGYS
ncbi:unnamed protein product [Onchocerca flexuosa]|uniref:PX domain-containing protein n=1 Tax=Onchocerca flexuosa TaxID=387005 RepID=A0A183H9A2_9BILA|nr:unnamed protein product [Onchocerca flexuosa]